MIRFLTFIILFLCSTQSLSCGEISTRYRARTRLNLDINPENFTFPDVSQANYQQGHIKELNACRVRVRSNTSWILSICTPDSDMGTLGGRPKPITDFGWKLSNQNSWNPISQTSEVVHQGSGNRTGWLDFGILLDWENDAPGEYELTIVLTLAEDV